MNDKEKYVNLFGEVLSIKGDTAYDSLALGVTPEWDSIAHIQLISAIEQTFAIVLTVDDLKSFKSFNDGKKILSNHGIKI